MMSVTRKSAKLGRRGAVPASLACPANEPGGCQGTLVFETLEKVRAGLGARKRKVKLGTLSFRIPGGARAVVEIALSKKNQRLVKKLRKVRLLLLIEARDQAGNRSTGKAVLTLRA